MASTGWQQYRGQTDLKSECEKDLDLDHMVLKIRYFGFPTANVKLSMRLAAEKVLPKLS